MTSYYDSSRDMQKIYEANGMFRIKIPLQTLIIIWWIGAVLAGLSLLIPQYKLYFVSGSIGWGIVVASSALIIFEIKKIKEDDKRRVESGK